MAESAAGLDQRPWGLRFVGWLGWEIWKLLKVLFFIYTLEDLRLEPTNHLSRKENDLNLTSMIMFHVYLQGCIFYSWALLNTWFTVEIVKVEISVSCLKMKED